MSESDKEFDLDVQPAELDKKNNIEKVPTISLDVPLRMKSLKMGPKNEIEVTFTLKDFPIEENKTIYGDEEGTGSVMGQLAYAKKHNHTFIAAIKSIQPKEITESETDESKDN